MIYFGPFAPADESNPVACRADRACRGWCGISRPTNGRTCAPDGPSRQSWRPAVITPGGYQPGCSWLPRPHLPDRPRHRRYRRDSWIQPPAWPFTRVGGPDGVHPTPRRTRRCYHRCRRTRQTALATKLRAAPAKQQDCGDVPATPLRVSADDGRLTMPPEMATSPATVIDALGFAGTTVQSAPGSATGLTHLGGGFADVLSQPMLPHTWDGSD